MTQFHDWEWFTGKVPKGRVQVQTREMSREDAERGNFWGYWCWTHHDCDPQYIIAYRRIKDPVRGDVVLSGWCNDGHRGVFFGNGPNPHDTHRLTLPTEDGALICGEYVGPGGAVVKVARLAIEDDGA